MFKILFRGKKLTGIDAIMKFLNLLDISTVQSWIIGYDFPAKKENGSYVVYVTDIKKWQATHPDVKEIQRPDYDVVQHRTVKTKWGVEVAQRRIIKL